jgi:hypothetical protein
MLNAQAVQIKRRLQRSAHSPRDVLEYASRWEATRLELSPMDEKLFQLIYISAASYRFSQQQLTELLDQSRKVNLEHKITGLLLYAKGHFIQLLEGDKKTIEDLMARITQDPRHHHVEVLEQGSGRDRQFAQWSMAFVDFASPEVRALAGYSTFLDNPIEVADLSDPSTKMRSLHYFKAVMLASKQEALALAEKIRQDRLKH